MGRFRHNASKYAQETCVKLQDNTADVGGRQPARPIGRACCIPPQVFNALPTQSRDIFLSRPHHLCSRVGWITITQFRARGRNSRASLIRRRQLFMWYLIRTRTTRCAHRAPLPARKLHLVKNFSAGNFPQKRPHCEQIEFSPVPNIADASGTSHHESAAATFDAIWHALYPSFELMLRCTHNAVAVADLSLAFSSSSAFSIRLIL